MKQRLYNPLNSASLIFKVISVSLLSSLLIGQASAQKQSDLDVITNYWLQYSNAPNSLYDYLTGEAYKLLQKRAATVQQIKDVTEWRKRQAAIKQALWEIIRRFPERTPLNARITSTVKENGYRVENIIYESLPGFYVTASLFIPENLTAPTPAILFCSGHTSGVYRVALYQLPLLNLVKKGFIVLAIDPIGQGERLQYYDPAKGASVIGSSTQEHSYPAAQAFLLGKSVARYWIWDGIRSIDYLVSRKEVDPKRIGVHGLSGGGTQTAYISAMDDRVTASAPAGYITSYRRLLESVGVQDGEQNFYHELERGIDHADFIEARAPKPTLIMATTRDFFSIQGARETYKELKQIYTILGKPDNIAITEDDYVHGYTKKNREAMYAFFQKHLNLPGSPVEEEPEYLSARELQKTSTGQLSNSIGGETVFSLIKQDAERMISKLQGSRKDLPAYLSTVTERAKSLSGFIGPKQVLDPVFTGRFQKDAYVLEKYYVQGEGNYVIPYLLFVPVKSNTKALIYLNPAGKSAEASAGGEVESFVKCGFTVLAPDLIGMGEMGPSSLRGDSVIGNISYNMWFTCTITGRTITGLRAGDVIRLRMLLSKRNDIKEIYGIARKEMAPVMLYASAFDSAISGIALIEPYSSYKSFVINRFYFTGFVTSLVPGALTAYDLPDLAGTLAPRMLTMAGTTDANGEKTDPEAINNDLSLIRMAYKARNADSLLRIINDAPAKASDLLTDWMK